MMGERRGSMADRSKIAAIKHILAGCIKERVETKTDIKGIENVGNGMMMKIVDAMGEISAKLGLLENVERGYKDQGRRGI